MTTTIYYFTATGNSLSIAKKLQAELGNAELKSIKNLKDSGHVIDSETVGFVFPIYAWGMPSIVKEFIQSAEFKGVKYVFGIAGCAGIAGNTLVSLKKLLKKNGKTLNSGFILKEPGNGVNLDEDNDFRNLVQKHKGTRSHRSIDERINELSNIIKTRTDAPLEKDSIKINGITNLINKAAVSSFKKSDKAYWTTDDCTGCGICAKVCPRDNITIEVKRPKWHNNCEACAGCINWCPNHSLQSGDTSEGRPRYQKSGISVQDVL